MSTYLENVFSPTFDPDRYTREQLISILVAFDDMVGFVDVLSAMKQLGIDDSPRAVLNVLEAKRHITSNYHQE